MFVWDTGGVFELSKQPIYQIRGHWSQNAILSVKSLLRTNVLNDVTPAPFLVFFLLLAAEKKTPKTGAARNPDFFLFTVCSVWKNKSWYFCLIPVIMLHYGRFGDLLPKNTLHSKNSRNWLFYHQKHHKYS